MEIVIAIAAILAGVAVVLPLAAKLVIATANVVKEKNWPQVMTAVLQLMEEAEELNESGAEKKEYVLTAIQEISDVINYDLDADALNKISAMIDEIIAATKLINVKE